MKHSLLTVLTVLVLAALCAAQIPTSNHVFVVAEENHSYSSVIGSSSMPYLNSLASKYGLATQYYANTHPSIGNYFMMTTGQILTNDDSQTPASFPVSADNIVRHLITAGKTWKAYAESLPYAGYTGGDVYPYAVRHNPLAYITDVQNSSNEKLNLVPFSQFATDLASNQLPNFSFIVPNVLDDAHDGTLQQADSWLQQNIAPLLASPAFQQDGILIISFDESFDTDTAYGGGQVATVVIGPNVKLGYQSSTLYQHQNLLCTAMTALGLTTFPGAAATATPLADFFGTTTTSSGVQVTVQSPAAGTTVGSPVQFAATATSAHPITGFVVYANNQNVYQTNSSSLSASVTLNPGTYNAFIRAWDSTGAYGTSPTFSITVGATTTTSVQVTVSSPTAGATVGSPVQFAATATSAHPITGFVVYANNQNVSQTNGSTLNASVALGAGTYSIYIRAWDSTGAYGTSPTFSITVSATTTSGVQVVVQSPAAGATVGSPVQFAATATSAHPITGFVVYANNQNVYQTNGSSLNASVALGAGTYSIYIRAWDSAGAYGTSPTFSITVGTTTTSGVQVTVQSPTTGVTVNSPVQFVAAATSAHPITGFVVYANNQNVYQMNGSTLNASVAFSAGTYSIYIRAWDSSGAYGTSATFSITVGATTASSTNNQAGLVADLQGMDSPTLKDERHGSSRPVFARCSGAGLQAALDSGSFLVIIPRNNQQEWQWVRFIIVAAEEV